LRAPLRVASGRLGRGGRTARLPDVPASRPARLPSSGARPGDRVRPGAALPPVSASARSERSMKLRLDIAYLGTRFEGWQAQEGERAARTVQGEIETALASLLGGSVRLHGAGRTDAGVHAEAPVAHLEVPEGAPSLPLP